MKDNCQCQCKRPYPNPEHGDTCLNCGKDIMEEADNKLYDKEPFGINVGHELAGGLNEPSY